MARCAVLAGRTLADPSRSVVSLGVMPGLGVLVGFRFHSDLDSIIAAMARWSAPGFEDAEKANYPVSLMCRVLGVNRTSLHDWWHRPPPRGVRRAGLTFGPRRLCELEDRPASRTLAVDHA